MAQTKYLKQQLDKIPVTKKFKNKMMDIVEIFNKNMYSENALYFIMFEAYSLIYENKKVRENYYNKLIRRENNNDSPHDDETNLLIVETIREIVEKIIEIDKEYREFALTLIFRTYMNGFPIAYIFLKDDKKWKDIEYQGSQVQYHEDCSSIFRDTQSGDIYQINCFNFTTALVKKAAWSSAKWMN